MSGVVFHDIAEGIMAQSLKLEAIDARDSLSILIPHVKNGNILAADYVLTHLGFEPLGEHSQMPDVHGMGARDAVYLIESRGLKVKLHGRGKVVEQSIGPGSKIAKGMTCVLRLA